VQIACDEDAGGHASFCAKVTDPVANGAPAILTPVPATHEIYVLIDEYFGLSLWNNTTDRGWTVKMF
jgi:hypothetical protein